MAESALEIETGAELERFDLGTVMIARSRYTVLTGHEGTGMCFWCGGELAGRLKRYCRGHMKLYYRYFMWTSARDWCLERYNHRCGNCGKTGTENYDELKDIHSDFSPGLALQAHHIVPLNGNRRDFSAFNLPWNLICLCYACHIDIHTAMRPESKPKPTYSELAIARGQLPMGFTI